MQAVQSEDIQLQFEIGDNVQISTIQNAVVSGSAVVENVIKGVFSVSTIDKDGTVHFEPATGTPTPVYYLTLPKFGGD